MSDRRDQNQHWKGVEGHHPPTVAVVVFSSGGTRTRTRTGEGFFSICCRTNVGLTPTMPNVGLVLLAEAPVKGALLLLGFSLQNLITSLPL